jgi:hypothetical protein
MPLDEHPVIDPDAWRFQDVGLSHLKIALEFPDGASIRCNIELEIDDAI